MAKQSIPKGWRLVPDRASDDMMDAAVEAARRKPPPNWKGGGIPGYTQLRAAYDAMLLAAPKPPRK